MGVWDEFGLVEKTPPGTVGLPASHLRATVRPVTRRRGCGRHVSAEQGRQGASCSNRGALDNTFPQRVDGLAAHRLSTRQVGHDGGLLIELSDPGRIVVGGPLNEPAVRTSGSRAFSLSDIGVLSYWIRSGQT